MTPWDDQVTRGDLALIVKTAAEEQARRRGEDAIGLAEAERIAASPSARRTVTWKLGSSSLG